MIKQDICIFLSEFFLHFIIQFYILMSLPVLLSQWNLSEWIKAESYKQKPKFFSCLCYQAANISQKPSVYFAFVTIPVGKNVHKRSVCWLAVIGRAWRAEWRIQMEERVQPWVMEDAFPDPVVLHASVPVVSSGLFAESTHWHKGSACLSVP